MKVTWGFEAKEQLREIYGHIRKESAQGAKKVKDAILARARELPSNPYMYEQDKYKIDNPGNYRAFVVYSYRIAYKVTEENILILRIRHTSREPLEYI